MKKLMLTAAAAALAGTTFAANVGNIFDYKASVKYVDFQKISAKNKYGAKSDILVKTVKSATLTGYLVTPLCCPCEQVDNTANGPCERFGMAPSFLVLQNKATNKYSDYFKCSRVKLMPANLLTEWWTKSSIDGLQKNKDIEAQGYLFAGVGKRDVPDPKASPFYGLGDWGIYKAADWYKLRTAGTQFLFGYYNVVDAPDAFIEPFLDHAGFGKARYYFTKGSVAPKSPCYVGKKGDDAWEICLTSLSGTLIGGSFACALNAGYAEKPVKSGFPWSYVGGSAWDFTEDYICQGWDDKTENAMSINSVNAYDQLKQEFANPYFYNVVCGTWSIKVNTKIDSGATERESVYNCAKKIDTNFSFFGFDYTSQSELNGLAGDFYKKWIANLP